MSFFNDLRQSQNNLVLVTIVFLILFLVLAIISLFDSTQILGINRWIKPMKFASSIAIYGFTLAIFLKYLDGFEREKKLIANGVILLMIGEMALVVMQASRGTASHFNFANPFDGMVFAAMGLMIVINTLLVVWLCFLYWRNEINFPKPIVLGMRLGLVLFILGSIQGGYMSAQVGHAVGTTDGGAGLPFANWSTTHGDLRVAHFFGLHSLQIIPIFAVLIEKFRFNLANILVIIFSAIYFAVFSLMFIQALLGKPFLSL